jgi:hypothetical protein
VTVDDSTPAGRSGARTIPSSVVMAGFQGPSVLIAGSVPTLHFTIFGLELVDHNFPFDNKLANWSFFFFFAPEKFPATLKQRMNHLCSYHMVVPVAAPKTSNAGAVGCSKLSA